MDKQRETGDYFLSVIERGDVVLREKQEKDKTIKSQTDQTRNASSKSRMT